MLCTSIEREVKDKRLKLKPRRVPRQLQWFLHEFTDTLAHDYGITKEQALAVLTKAMDAEIWLEWFMDNQFQPVMEEMLEVCFDEHGKRFYKLKESE